MHILTIVNMSIRLTPVEVPVPTIRVFEPALCCNTGVCGPDLDQELVTFTADVQSLQAEGVDIGRVNLASDPSAFAQNPVVVNYLKVAGSDGLPLTLVNDTTVLTGRHPTRAELRKYAGLPDTSLPADLRHEAEGCCAGSDPAAAPAACCSEETSAGSQNTGCDQNPTTSCC